MYYMYYFDRSRHTIGAGATFTRTPQASSQMANIAMIPYLLRNIAALQMLQIFFTLLHASGTLDRLRANPDGVQAGGGGGEPGGFLSEWGRMLSTRDILMLFYM